MSQEQSAKLILKETGGLRLGWFPSLEELVESLPEFFLTKIAAMESPAALSATTKLLHAVCIIENCQRPVFRVTPTLAALLKNTELPGNLDIDFLRLPFEGIIIEIPPGTLTGPAERATKLYVTNLPGDRFRVLYCNDDLWMVNFASIDPSAGTSIAEVVANTRKKAFLQIPEDLAEDLLKEQMYDDYFSADFFVFAVNAALYITSEGADVEQDKAKVRDISARLQGVRGGRRRDTLMEQLQRAKNRRIYICGAKIKQCKELEAHLTEEGRKLTRRFRVRGHWRNQACGEGRQDHKHIFIAPHWKGPTYAEMLQRNYVVRGPDENDRGPG